MDLDALLDHYFGDDPETLDDAGYERALERIAIDFGKETDPGRRFALWAMMHSLGQAPDPKAAFEDRELREAARSYAQLSGLADKG